MAGIEKMFVSLEIEGEKYDVGELVLTRQNIYFRYNKDFLDKGLNISPIKLPYNDIITSAANEPFEGLYGVFNDSLPDGWGRLLIDRTLIRRGINLDKITPLDRLAYVGAKGRGSLCYRPELQDGIDFYAGFDLDSIANNVNLVLQGVSSEIIEELFALGGSSGGARPKILVAYNRGSDELVHGMKKLHKGFKHWIIKFPSSSDSPGIARIEYAYHKMAVNAGIEMSECRLFEGKSGNLYFGTIRFDRIGDKRLHMHTAAGIMHDNFRASTMDYGHLMDCAFRLEKHVKAYEKVFRLAAFNVFAHNMDDHSNNFSFLMNSKGDWRLAPAYDLSFSYSSYGFHSTMVAGESKNPGTAHLLKLAEHFGLKNAGKIIEEVREAIAQWETIANDCDISKATIKNIRKSLDEIAARR